MKTWDGLTYQTPLGGTEHYSALQKQMNRHLAPELYTLAVLQGCRYLPGTLLTQGKLQQRSPTRAWEMCGPSVLLYLGCTVVSTKFLLSWKTLLLCWWFVLSCSQPLGRWGFMDPSFHLFCLSLPHFILSIFLWSVLFSGSFIVIIQNMNRSEYPLSYECNQFWVFNCNFFSIKFF